MKALVTGATGFVGSHLVEGLIKKGYEVTCLVRKTSDTKWIEGFDLEVLQGDCLEEGSVRGAVKGADVVFHVAGVTKACSEREFFEVNVRGTENVLSAVAGENPGLRRFVHISSLAAVGPSRNGSPVDEQTPPNPVSSYGRSKLEAERAVLTRKGDIPVTVIRPPAVYGPRDRDLYVFYRMVKKGIFPDWGRCCYSLLYIDDLVKGIMAAAEAPEAEGEVFFLSEGHYTNEHIAGVISEAVGRKPVRLRVPRAMVSVMAVISERLGRGRPGIINRDKARELTYPGWVCDSTKAGRKLGFSPKIKLNEGIKWTANWYRIHQWL
jgi:nucleoside-diphosphate-sugar epimerase